MILLSIIITHYKTPELLKQCIKAIKKNIQNINCQIIVTDSQATPENQKIIKNLFPGIIYLVFKKNVGFSQLVNQGIKRAQGKYLLIINADTIIDEKETIKEMIKCFEKHPEIGLLGPRLLNLDGTWQQSCFRFYSLITVLCRRTFLGKLPWGKNFLNHFLMKDALDKETSKNKNPIPVDWLMGSVLFTKRTALKKVGLLDERFFMYFEDVDWSRRFWEAGFKVVYFPKVYVYHHYLRASKKRGGILDLFSSKYTQIHLLSALKYFLKYGLRTPSYGS